MHAVPRTLFQLNIRKQFELETSAWQYLVNSSAHGTKQSSDMGLPHGRSPTICSSLASEICFGLAGEFLKMKLRQLRLWFI